MIKKLILHTLLVIMVAAFTAVVVVQWLWIKYAIKERENKFTSQVYDVLNKVVGRIDEINYIKYRREMSQQLGEIKSYNDMIVAQQGTGTNIGWYADNLVNFLNNDLNRLSSGRSYLSNPAIPLVHSGTGKIVDQEFIMQTIRSMELPQQDSTSGTDFYVRFSQKMQEFMMRLVKEKDPENVSVSQRLANIDLAGMLVNNFRAYNINLPFTYEIMTKQNVLDNVKAGRTENLYYVDLFQQDLVKKGYYLGVRFESVQPVLLENMGWLFLSSGFLDCYVYLLSLLLLSCDSKSYLL